jgi:ketosteroid isomerase-like protein
MLRPLAGILAVAALVACTSTSRTDVATVRHVIDSLNTRAERWYATGQVDSLVQNFAEDAWQMPPNSQPLVGRDSVRRFWTGVVRLGSVNFDFEIADVVAADSIAVERGRYTLEFTAGPQPNLASFEDEGNYVALWRRESDGHWRIFWDAAVSIRPPNATSTSASTGR